MRPPFATTLPLATACTASGADGAAAAPSSSPYMQNRKRPRTHGIAMHDRRFAALDAVLDHYERLASVSAADARLRRAPLTTSEHRRSANSSFP